jgi:mRNA interferase RelE/StbE
VTSAWKIEITPKARRQLNKLDREASRRIVEGLDRIRGRDGDPRALGKALVGEWTGFWRYRIGAYRVICRIEDAVVTVFVIEVGHRREIYR